MNGMKKMKPAHKMRLIKKIRVFQKKKIPVQYDAGKKEEAGSDNKAT